MSVSRHARAGLVAGLLTLIIDQISKYWFVDIFDLETNGPVQVAPFFDFLLVWNHGVSYGLFQQDSDFGRYLLIAITSIASIALIIWLLRVDNRLTALSLGLVVGGAIGNVIDRVARGAVVDVFHFHWGSFSWYVFNLADVAIVAGVAGLLYDTVFSSHNDAKNGS